MRFEWSWETAAESLPVLLEGFQVTVLVTILGMTLALVGGLLLDILRRAPFKPVSYTAAFVVEFVRSTPLLVQLFFLYFVLPEWGIQFPDLGRFFSSEFLTGMIGLGLHYSSYTAEVYRAGIDNVPKGQWEAARALNMNPLRTWVSVILPQAIRPIVPVLGNYLIAMFKDTPLLYGIGVFEAMTAANQFGSESFSYVEPITIVGVMFLLASLISAQLVKGVERLVRLPGR